MIVQRRDLGECAYLPCWQAMQAFTATRVPGDTDELWLCSHPAVFTLGRAGKAEHVLAPGDIPVVRSDRGGQVTFHGPGQLVVYPLLDVRRLGLGPRELVRRLEQSVIDTLAGRGVVGTRQPGAPGVYVAGAKIAALGLRIRGAYSYHGLAFNLAMDLEPYRRINPCGYAGLAVTDLRRLIGAVAPAVLADELVAALCRNVYAGLDVTLRAAAPTLPVLNAD